MNLTPREINKYSFIEQIELNFRMHVVTFVTDRTSINRSICVPKAQNVKYTLEQAMMMMANVRY